MTKPNRIAHFRKVAGLTQQQLADKVGSHWITISKLERGVNGLSVDWMERLAEPLGVKPHELMASTEDRLEAMDAKLDRIIAMMRELKA